MTETEVRLHAVQFRRCLEHLQSKLGMAFLSFPAGSCGDSSKLLGQWLTDHGLSHLSYVAAERGGKSHTWLEWDELIIDITADQFEDAPGSVYVSTDRSFHGQFSHQIRIPHRLDEELRRDYLQCRRWMAHASGLGGCDDTSK